MHCRFVGAVLAVAVLSGLNCRARNEAPSAPVVTGPDSGLIRTPLTFGATTEEPNGDSVAFQFDWGDGDTSAWTAFGPPGATLTDTHSWYMPDTYSIRARARDEHGDTADWSDPHTIVTTARPGTKLWLLEVGECWSSPAIDENGVIYVGNHAGVLTAIWPDGTVKWRAVTGEPLSSPSIGADGTVYVGAGKSVLAFSNSGARLWAYATQGRIYSCPAIGADGTLYVGSEDGNLYALNQDGSLRWRADSCGSGYHPSIGRDGTVYANGLQAMVTAVDPTGNRKWSCPFSCGVQSPPAIGQDGTIYVAADSGGDCGNFILAISPDGQVLWFYGNESENIEDAPAIGPDGSLYFTFWLCEDGEGWECARALRADGTPLWCFCPEDDDGWSSPAVGSDGTVYVAGASMSFFAINHGGFHDWLSKFGGTMSAPTLANGVAYVVSYSGYLWAIAIEGGPADAPWPMSMHDAQHTCRAR